MKILDVLTSPWAIVPEKLREITEIYQTHLKGNKIDLDIFKSGLNFGQTQEDGEELYEVINGVAVIEIQGVLSKKLSFFSWIFGGASTQGVAESFKAALNDSAVKSILLNIDSPGGSVDGTAELAQLIYEARGRKPVITFTDGMMASAAYWIGAAADSIYISSDTTETGSIGVIATVIDYSEAFKKEGIKVTEIVAGKYKAVGSPYKPLSDDDRKIIHDEVDYIYSVFVNAIAKYRGVSVDHVLSVMATDTPPPVFIGKQAINAGLVDGISTMDQLLNRLADGDSANMLFSVGIEHKNKKGYKEVESMNLKELKEKYPDLYQSVIDEGEKIGFKKGQADAGDSKLAEGIAQGKKEGSEAECKRIQGVEGQLIPGHEAIIQELKFDGKTTGPEAAVKVLAAEKKKLDDIAVAIAADGVRPAPQPAIDPISEGQATETKKEKLIQAYEKENKVSYKDAVLAVSREHPELFKGGN